MITPADIENKVFSKAVRGYKEEEVDEFLDLLTLDLEKVLNENNGIVKKEQLTKLGIDSKRIMTLVNDGTLVRIKNGYYTDRIDRFSEEELVAALFPDGLLCMESALYAYGYIKEKPFAWSIAIDKNTSKSRFKMDFPKILPISL